MVCGWFANRRWYEDIGKCLANASQIPRSSSTDHRQTIRRPFAQPMGRQPADNLQTTSSSRAVNLQTNSRLYSLRFRCARTADCLWIVCECTVATNHPQTIRRQGKTPPPVPQWSADCLRIVVASTTNCRQSADKPARVRPLQW